MSELQCLLFLHPTARDSKARGQCPLGQCSHERTVVERVLGTMPDSPTESAEVAPHWGAGTRREYGPTNKKTFSPQCPHSHSASPCLCLHCEHAGLVPFPWICNSQVYPRWAGGRCGSRACSITALSSTSTYPFLRSVGMDSPLRQCPPIFVSFLKEISFTIAAVLPLDIVLVLLIASKNHPSNRKSRSFSVVWH